MFSANIMMAGFFATPDPARALELCDHALTRLAEIKGRPIGVLESEALAESDVCFARARPGHRGSPQVGCRP